MLTDGDYIVRMINLPGDIYGAIRISDTDFANIYINDQLSPMAKRRAFRHEIMHLERDDLYSDASITDIEST